MFPRRPERKLLAALWNIFRKKHALAKAGVVTGFPPENATTQRRLN
jgi:hypothetical protein